MLNGLVDYLIMADSIDDFYRKVLLNPRSTSLDPYIRSRLMGSKPELLDTVVFAEIYKRHVRVYDAANAQLIIIAGMQWADENEAIRLVYWRESGHFDAL